MDKIILISSLLFSSTSSELAFESHANFKKKLSGAAIVLQTNWFNRFKQK